MESPHWQFSFKKVIISAYSKSSNSSGFNPILQKFYHMICEIIVSKTVCGIFLILCRSSFIDNFIVKSNFSQPKNHPNLNISRPICLIKISAHRFEDLICTNKLEEIFFRKKNFLRTWIFFCDCKTTDLVLIFFHIEFILYFFSSVIIWF